MTEINPQEFFKHSGFDINLLLDKKHFTSKICNLKVLPNKKTLAPNKSHTYVLEYYVKMSGDFDLNFDPKGFLDKLSF